MSTIDESFVTRVDRHSEAYAGRTPDPPSYYEAIGYSSVPAEHHAVAVDLSAVPAVEFQTSEAFDIEDELYYQESGSLRAGEVPNAPAQFTFIQPTDNHQQTWWNQRKSHANEYYYYLSYEPSRYDSFTNNISHPTVVKTLGTGYQAYSGAPPPSSHAEGCSSSARVQGQDPYSRPPIQTLPFKGDDVDTDTAAVTTQDPAATPEVHPSKSELYSNGAIKYAPPISPSSPLPGQRTSPTARPIGPSFPSSSTTLPHYQGPDEQFAGIPSPADIAARGGHPLMNPQDISIAEFKRTSKGVESTDPILEHDAYQLYRYFIAHNDRPEMYALITGYHVEYRQTVTTDSDGKAHRTTTSTNVEDFRIEFDLTPFVSPRGVVFTTPTAAATEATATTGQHPSLRSVFEEHAKDDNEFKEMHMKKVVKWDYGELTRAIVHAVRYTHYQHHVEVSFPLQNDRVKVSSSSSLAKFMRSYWTKAFCFLGVVGFVFYPIRECYKRAREENIQSYFEMTLSTREFYYANFWSIVEQVSHRMCEN
ncbi:hypothetical protein BG004_004170 [Podila humilis]|nr:hypothetical protein BG004_004170 [Podila humilis]